MVAIQSVRAEESIARRAKSRGGNYLMVEVALIEGGALGFGGGG